MRSVASCFSTAVCRLGGASRVKESAAKDSSPNDICSDSSKIGMDGRPKLGMLACRFTLTLWLGRWSLRGSLSLFLEVALRVVDLPPASGLGGPPDKSADNRLPTLVDPDGVSGGLSGGDGGLCTDSLLPTLEPANLLRIEEELMIGEEESLLPPPELDTGL